MSCAVIIALTLGAELDATGYERRTPDPADVESVSLTYYGEQVELSRPENIAAVVGFHEEVIAQKGANEGAADRQWLGVEYTLRDGKHMKRDYSIADGAENRTDPDSNIRRLGAVLNTQEAVDSRIDFARGRAVTPASIAYAAISGAYMDEKGEWRNVAAELTAEQAVQLYNECVVPDSKDSRLGHVWTVQDDEYFDTVGNLSLDIQLRMERGRINEYAMRDYAYITLTMDAARCAAWLEENTDLTLLPLRESDPDYAAAAQLPVMTREAAIGVIGGADGPTEIFVG